jgi:hypothetical protein
VIFSGQVMMETGHRGTEASETPHSERYIQVLVPEKAETAEI